MMKKVQREFLLKEYKKCNGVCPDCSNIMTLRMLELFNYYDATSLEHAKVKENNKRVASIDHIYPKSLKGSDDFKNLRVICLHCNMRKGSKINDILVEKS